MEYKKVINSIKKRLTNKAKRVIKSIRGSVFDPYKKNKIKKGNLEIPSNIIQEKKSVKRKYPKISPFYPDSTFKEELSERAKHFETAAVVFNSGKALKNENGSEIDDKGVVFRINFMPTRGFEKKVGSRTTVRVLGREWLFSEKDEILVRTYCKKEYIEKEYNNYKRSEKLRRKGVYASKEINRLFQPYLRGMMTNGFRAVIIGLANCDKVLIYGGDPEGAKNAESGSVSKFPTERERRYIEKRMKNWGVKQDLDRYFDPISNGKQAKNLHSSLKKEYEFYSLHPRVILK